MSDLDKTSKQLIDSIRKTKAGPATAAVKTAKGKTATRKTAKPKASSAAPISKRPRVQTKNRTAASKKTPPESTTLAIEQVPFQDGSRVWPD